MTDTKILFATDVHGGETFFGKILSVAKNFKVNILLISGDLTGKAIVPIVKNDEGRYFTTFFGVNYNVGDDKLPELENKIRKVGYYSFRCSLKEYEAFKAEPKKVDELFRKLIQDTLYNWAEKIEATLPADMRVIMNPGNDDDFAVDEVLKKSKRLEYTLERTVDLDDLHQMASCEWVNPTPWNSPRECSEEDLEKRLRREMKRVSDMSNLICDIHAPPYDTPLDLAPKLNKDLQPKTFIGQPVYDHVGSKSVRKILKEYQPLLGLHGHIHESASKCNIGRTICVNPGSEYNEGIMHAYLITLMPTNVDCQPVIGG
jgi:Icc-related predicted phosphoesterase